MLRKIFTSITWISLLFLCCQKVVAQDKISQEDLTTLHTLEDSMVLNADSMYAAFVPDTHIGYCQEFVKQLRRALKIPNSYYYPFDKLKDKINIIYPDDNAFRIFNWSINTSLVATRYYGAIQLPGETLKIYPLVDYTDELSDHPEDSVLTGNKWFGALYYRILTHQVNGEKIYTLFGLNASSLISTRKVLDPMTITETGATFGAHIFNIDTNGMADTHLNRFIMEYKKGVQAGLNWDDQKQIIYFDKLVSQTNDPHRKYTYVPSGEYDGFKWENDQWHYVKDLIPVQILKDGEAPSGTAPEN